MRRISVHGLRVSVLPASSHAHSGYRATGELERRRATRSGHSQGPGAHENGFGEQRCGQRRSCPWCAPTSRPWLWGAGGLTCSRSCGGGRARASRPTIRTGTRFCCATHLTKGAPSATRRRRSDNGSAHLADCTTDADCVSDNLCLRTRYDDGCHVKTQYRCQTADDTCAEDADCPEEHQCGFLADEGRHACLPSHLCNAGRPFLVRGDERLADARRTTEWLDVAPTRRGTLTGERAAVLAASWTRVGLMEHASIAAFARFALQLLALGAPPDLVSATSEAMIDETRHAQIAFGLASRYGAEPIGPGKLSMDAALEELDIESILVNAILEGCCGETAAAYEVAVAAEGAAGPVLRETLARIAEDERRHADLAWNFVRWSLQRNPALKTAALRAVELELAQARALPPAPLEDAWLEEHSVLPEARRQALRVEALEQLVLPCMRSLCAALPQASVGETGARTELAGELSRSLPHHQILEGLANCDLVL